MKGLPAGEPDVSAAAGLEPFGGNLYRPHMFQVNSGRFWRCAHGLTGFDEGKTGLEWVGCKECEAEDPAAFERWNSI
jgi:hypothetical protein